LRKIAMKSLNMLIVLVVLLNFHKTFNCALLLLNYIISYRKWDIISIWNIAWRLTVKVRKFFRSQRQSYSHLWFLSLELNELVVSNSSNVYFELD
jgi:hypothetical protein